MNLPTDPITRSPGEELHRSFKFGSVLPSHGPIEHRYGDLWDIQPTTGPERLIAAPSSGHVSLMEALMEELPEPFGILYVLIVSRGSHEPARYESPSPTDRKTTLAFLREYEEFFERDARHHVWVMSVPLSATIVYDNHNVIYAYGPLDRFQRVVHLRGLERSRIRFPVPHTHNYNAEYDDRADGLMQHWEWIRSPLHEDDN